MRRLISVALTVFMILSIMTGVFSTTVSAADADGSVPSGYTPEGTAINTAEEFAAMTADGKYYLAADITITASYAADFKGTFDGNGKTVTVSAPMFAHLVGATVKNLKTVGQIDYADYAPANQLNTGAVAGIATLSTFENVLNEAIINGAKTGYVLDVVNPDTLETTKEYHGLNSGGIVGLIEGTTTFTDCANGGAVTAITPGGLVGRFEKILVEETVEGEVVEVPQDSVVIFKNCQNYGRISDEGCEVMTEVQADGAVKTKLHGNAGAGIMAYAKTTNSGESQTEFYFDNCSNSADVQLLLEGPRAGGIVGYVYDVDNGPTVCNIIDCLNTGMIVGWDQIGGIGGWVRCNSKFVGNTNNGDVWSRNNYAGGMVSRAGSDGNSTEMEILYERCINTGEITGHRQYAAGMMGYSACDATFKYCFNSGTLKAEDINNLESSHQVNVAGIASNIALTCTVYSCVNTGNMEGNYISGGIIGRAGKSGNTGFNLIESCVNSGNVYSTNGFGTYYSDKCVGGIIGYNYGSGTSQFPIIRGCIVTGNLESRDCIACGLAGYFNTDAATFLCNYIGASIKGAATPPDFEHNGGYAIPEGQTDWSNAYILCWNNKSTSQNFECNYVPVGCTYKLECQAGIEKNLDGYEWFVTPEQVASGELAYMINDDWGEYTLVWQQIGVDQLPTNDYDEDFYKYYVEKDANGNFVNVEKNPDADTTTEETTTEKPDDVTTKAPDDETTKDPGDETTKAPGGETTKAPEATKAPETTEPPKEGGCGGAIGATAALVVVALLAPAGIMLKKKED